MKSRLTKTKTKSKSKPRSRAKAKASVAIELSAVTEPQSGFEPIESEKLTVETPECECTGAEPCAMPVETGIETKIERALKPPSHRYLIWGIVLVVLMLAASYLLIMY